MENDTWFNELDDNMIEIIDNNKDVSKSENMFDDNDENIKYIYIDEIINKNIDDYTSNEILQYECSIAYFIQVLIEGTTNNKIRTSKKYDKNLTFEKMNGMIEYLEWISNASKILALRINQKIIKYIPSYIPIIIRSSYNFCSKYTQCKEFYSKYNLPTCKDHHYVHATIKYDIDSVIFFLQYILKNSIQINDEDFNNLYLSIKTISFVTRHMAKEISYIDFIMEKNSEFFHRNNPSELKKNKKDDKAFKKNIHLNIDKNHNIYNILSDI